MASAVETSSRSRSRLAVGTASAQTRKYSPRVVLAGLIDKKVEAAWHLDEFWGILVIPRTLKKSGGGFGGYLCHLLTQFYSPNQDPNKASISRGFRGRAGGIRTRALQFIRLVL